MEKKTLIQMKTMKVEINIGINQKLVTKQGQIVLI